MDLSISNITHINITLSIYFFEQLLNKQDNPFRLPRDVRPSHYNIYPIPILDDGNFTTLGHVDIILDCNRDTTRIKLNRVNIKIDESSIQVHT